MKIIDTHCHLNDETLYKDLENVISRALNSGVDKMVVVGWDKQSSELAVKIAEQYPFIYAVIGFHPENIFDINDEILYETLNLCKHSKVVGIGEIGLDYHYTPETRKAQIKLFETQIEIAHKHNLPVAIHTRDSDEDTAAILSNETPGVMHCFTSGWDLAKTMLDRGFYFSASGILTFKNAESIRETFAKIPMDRIVIETDSPYCAPVPYRGKVCEPAFVIETAKVLAQIKKLQIDELETILYENTQRLYTKIKIG